MQPDAIYNADIERARRKSKRETQSREQVSRGVDVVETLDVHFENEGLEMEEKTSDESIA